MIDIEQVKTYYNKLNIELPIGRRFSQDGRRFYFTLEDGDVVFYPSVTTIINDTTPTSFGIKKLLADLGWEGYLHFMKVKADYGTLLHILISKYLKDGEYDFDLIAFDITNFVNEHNLIFESNQIFSIKKDLLSLIQFCNEYRVKPLAIELIGTYCDGIYKFAGAVDLVCKMTVQEKGYFGEVYKSGANKGEPKLSSQEKEVTAIVDFKSGKSGFYPDHAIQLNMYQLMLERMGVQVDKLYNVAPKDWENYPTYSIKDQTDSKEKAKIPHLLALYENEPKDLIIIDGLANGTTENCYKIISPKEFVKFKLEVV